MSELSQETKSKILQSAKKEFLEKGFMNASLRTIASNAGLTTGAMYRHFENKDALFCALVDDAVEVTLKLVEHGGVEYHKDLTDPAGKEHELEEHRLSGDFLEYMQKNSDAFTLLLTKASGSKHEHFMDEVADKYTENVFGTINYMKQKYSITKQIDDMSIHVLATATVNAYAEVVLHKMENQEAEVFLNNIQEFFHFGFMHLLGLPCGHE